MNKPPVQPSLFDAKAPSPKEIKQAAINQVMDNPATPEEWKEEALGLTRTYLVKNQFVISLDIRGYLDSLGYPGPHHNRVWGGLFQRLHKEKSIKPTDRFVQVDDGPSHCAPRRVWESLLYNEKPR